MFGAAKKSVTLCVPREKYFAHLNSVRTIKRGFTTPFFKCALIEFPVSAEAAEQQEQQSPLLFDFDFIFCLTAHF